MTLSDWETETRDYLNPDNPEDFILNVYDENPRRGGDIRNDIVTIETVPISLSNGDTIKWWGISVNDNNQSIWLFQDDELMSDYWGASDEGWSNSSSQIYSSDTGKSLKHGLGVIRDFIMFRQKGETV